jgi:hypothetical protein
MTIADVTTSAKPTDASTMYSQIGIKPPRSQKSLGLCGCPGGAFASHDPMPTGVGALSADFALVRDLVTGSHSVPYRHNSSSTRFSMISAKRMLYKLAEEGRSRNAYLPD